MFVDLDDESKGKKICFNFSSILGEFDEQLIHDLMETPPFKEWVAKNLPGAKFDQIDCELTDMVDELVDTCTKLNETKQKLAETMEKLKAVKEYVEQKKAEEAKSQETVPHYCKHHYAAIVLL